jgi:hypothetical protein
MSTYDKAILISDIIVLVASIFFWTRVWTPSSPPWEREREREKCVL